MVLCSGVLFALNGIVAKLLLRGGFDPPTLTAFRAGGAAIGLLLVCLVLRPGVRRLAVTRRELPRLIAFGLSGFFLVPMLYFVAISRLPVGIGLLFEYTAPLFVALWFRFGEHRPVKRRLWVGLAFCLVGLACVAQIFSGELRLDGVGVLAGLTCAVLLGGYYVLGSKSVVSRDAVSTTWWAFAVSATIGAIVRPWWTFDPHVLAGRSNGVPMWLLAAYLLIFGTMSAYLLVTASMRHLPATSVGILGMIEPVLASVFAWSLIGEVLSAVQIIGGVIVLAGVILAETARTQTDRAAQPLARDLDMIESA